MANAVLATTMLRVGVALLDPGEEDTRRVVEVTNQHTRPSESAWASCKFADESSLFSDSAFCMLYTVSFVSRELALLVPTRASVYQRRRGRRPSESGRHRY